MAPPAALTLAKHVCPTRQPHLPLRLRPRQALAYLAWAAPFLAPVLFLGVAPLVTFTAGAGIGLASERGPGSSRTYLGQIPCENVVAAEEPAPRAVA